MHQQKGFGLLALMISIFILISIIAAGSILIVPQKGKDGSQNTKSPIERANEIKQQLESFTRDISDIFKDEDKSKQDVQVEKTYNTFKEAFNKVKYIPTSPTSSFIEESGEFILKGRIIKEIHEAPVYCLTEPCDVEPEPYDVFLFQDLVNNDYKIQIEEKYLSQLSLEIGSTYTIKGNVIYLRKYQEVKIVRFEPVEVLARLLLKEESN